MLLLIYNNEIRWKYVKVQVHWICWTEVVLLKKMAVTARVWWFALRESLYHKQSFSKLESIIKKTYRKLNKKICKSYVKIYSTLYI
jgi:hypothetical protein